MPYYESFTEFENRMTADHDFIGGRHLFRNGAQSDGNVHIDPPTDPVALAKLKREFVTHRLDRTTKEFNDMKTYISEQATMRLRYPNAVPPRADSVEILKRLQGRIFRLRESLQEIATDPTTESTSMIRERIHAEMDLEQKQRVQQLVSEASLITI